MPEDLEIDPQSLRGMIEAKQPFFFLDCREPHEYEVARIDGATLIPMSEIQRRLGEIPKDRPVVVYCHHGMRSMNVTIWLRSNAVEARSLAGGIDRWSAEVDPSVPRY
jgi:rhodanese-related sulfurtransferase